MTSSKFSARRPAWAAALALAAAAFISGCALQPVAPGTAGIAGAQSGTAPHIAVPPTSIGTWYDLGHYLAPWMAGDAVVPVNGDNAPTRVAGLRREDGRWLAIVVAQRAPSGSAPCPLPSGLHVAAGASADGCLRVRRDGDFDRWLQAQHSVLYHWLEGRGWGSRPRAWVSARVPGGSQGAIETHALIDPSLIEPVTRTNVDFLAAGEPGVIWARQFAQATRAAANGPVVSVPPFPFAPRVALPPPPVTVAPLPLPSATQVPTRPPVQAPRRDRE